MPWLALSPLTHPTGGRKQFARHEWAQKAAYLLGCSLEELSSATFKHQPKGTLQRSTSFRQGPDDPPLGEGGTGRVRDGGDSGWPQAIWGWGCSGLPPTGPKLTALECLEGMAAGLYSELFTLLISLLNRYVLKGGGGRTGRGPSSIRSPLCVPLSPAGR